MRKNVNGLSNHKAHIVRRWSLFR